MMMNCESAFVGLKLENESAVSTLTIFTLQNSPLTVSPVLGVTNGVGVGVSVGGTRVAVGKGVNVGKGVCVGGGVKVGGGV